MLLMKAILFSKFVKSREKHSTITKIRKEIQLRLNSLVCYAFFSRSASIWRSGLSLFEPRPVPPSLVDSLDSFRSWAPFKQPSPLATLGGVTLTGETNYLHINTLARLTGTALSVASVTKC